MKASINPTPKSRLRHTALLAGAGTGKTTRIIEDIAKRIGSGDAEPSQVLALTFSRKATQETRQRLKDAIGSKAASITVNTFHSFAAGLLRQHARLVGLSRDFTVLHEGDLKSILKGILEQPSLSDTFTVKAPYKAIDYFINREEWPERIATKHEKAAITKVFDALKAELRANNCTTFSGLIMQALHLLNTQPQLQEEYASKYRNIYVDEFQDTSIAQYKLLKLLVGERTRFFVVGDDDQSIYGWRHVRPQMIAQFQKDFTCIKSDPLVENYRSSAMIVHTANGLISHNYNRDPKQLVPTLGDGDPVHVHQLVKQEREAKWIAETIIDIKNQPDGDDKTIAILCRHRPFFKKIEKALRVRNITYYSFDKKSAYGQPAVKLILNYLRALTNTKNAFVLKMVMKKLALGTCVKQIEEYAALQQLSFWKAAIRLNKLGKLAPVRAEFVDTFIAVQKYAAHHTTKEVVERIIKQERFGKFLTSKPAHQKAIDALLVNMTPIQTLSDFLDETLDGKDVSLFIEKSTVQLMTIHAAKGLEFDCLFLPAWEKDRFPFHLSKNIEEERRLAYVAITRAKEQLYISHVLERRDGLKNRMRVDEVAPSPFIEELPEAYIKTGRSKGAAKWEYNTQNFIESSCKIELDDVVSHNPYQDSKGNRINYGVGVVVKIQGDNITVEFNDGEVVKVKKSAVTKALLPKGRKRKKSV